MPIDKRRARKLPEYLESVESPNIHSQYFGTYIGVVRRTVDTQRLGRLQVFIPIICPTDDEANWVSVAYASPFYGFVDPKYDNPDGNLEGNLSYGNTKQSYGMWFVPPDPGVKVLITFANGDLNRGFWFACLPEGHSHYMVPSLGGSNKSDFKDGTTVLSEKPDIVPVAEFNDRDKKLDGAEAWFQNTKPMHQIQYDILKNQGLDFDYYRGPINSSSQRDIPSTTYGISTPGRPNPDPAFDTPGFANSAKSGTLKDSDLTPKNRKGGHTFVMDDGDTLGNNNLMRLRTSAGHQIVMHDTGKFIYISNSSGTAWIELNDNGDIEIFSQGEFSIRAADTLNLHADNNMNIYAGKALQIVAEDSIKFDTKSFSGRSTQFFGLSSTSDMQFKSGGAFKVDASSKLSLKGGSLSAISGSQIQLQGPTDTVQAIDAINRQNFPNSIRESKGYRVKSNRIKSIASRVPTHEPDLNHTTVSTQAGGTMVLASTSAGRSDGRVPAVEQISATDYGNTIKQDSTTGASTVPAQYSNLKSFLNKQPNPVKAVGSLTNDETKALLTSIGKSESTFNYQAVNQYGYIGKYQMGASALVSQGYIKPEYYKRYNGSNSVLDDPAAWTGKNGIGSKDDFLNSPDVQEVAMTDYTQSNYDALLRNGGIRPGDSPDTVAGMLQTSHLLGAGGAKKWRQTGQGADANNTSGKTYFDRGKYSIIALTNDGNIIS